MLKSGNGKYNPFKQDIQWDKAKFYQLSNGNKVVGIPLKLTLSQGNAKGAYYLLVSRDDVGFQSTVAYNDDKNYFNGNFSDNDIEKLLKKAQVLKTSYKKANASANKKVMLEDVAGSCIDWYFYTIEYDNDGNVIDYQETFLYQTCTSSGGGSDGDPTADACRDEAMTQMQGESSTVTEALVTDDGITRKKRYTWKFLSNYWGAWYYTSLEEGTHKRVNNEWQWDKIDHISVGRTGIVLGATISVDNVSIDPQIGVYNAGVVLYYSFSANAICKEIPIELNLTSNANSPIWNCRN